MRKALSLVIFFSLLLFIAGLYSCIPTETSNFNPNEKVFCDISSQLNGNDNSLKSEVRFYIKDSLYSRPYFLDKPVWMNGLEMNKKFTNHKGVYYSLTQILEENDDLKFSFFNLDDREYKINVPISFISQPVSNPYTIDKITALNPKGNESIILIDSKNKIFDFSKERQNIENISSGKAQIMRLITEDSLFQLKDKLWVKYNSKSLSSKQIIEIE